MTEQIAKPRGQAFWIGLDRAVVILAMLGWGLVIFAPRSSVLSGLGMICVGLGLGYMGRATWVSSQ